MERPPGRIATAWRELRVAGPAPAAPGRSAACFAAAVRERYLQRPVAPGAAATEFLRPPRGSSPAIQQVVTLHLAPRFTVVQPVVREAGTRTWRELTVVHARPGVPKRPLQVLLQQAREVARAGLQATRPPAAPAMVLPTAIARGRTRVEQRMPPPKAVVVRRPPPEAAAAVHGGATPTPSSPVPAVDPLSRTAHLPPAQPPGEADLRRLTDQVIRRIDQRIVAQRERRGRP